MYDPLPGWLQSAQHERPFAERTVCQVRLGGGGVEYMIMKSYQRDECVFEMAVCRARHEEQAERWSSASRGAASEFSSRVMDHLDHDVGENCDYCGKPVDKIAGMTIYAQCAGDLLWMSHHMCGSCQEELQSPETREEQDRFLEHHFPGPPGLEEPAPGEGPSERGTPREDVGRGTPYRPNGPGSHRARP